MKDKIVLITGANAGIGKETAKELAKQGATVVMACRNMMKARQAQLEILDESKNPNVDLMIVDLASQASIQTFAAKFKEKYPQLDVLINNAGVFFEDYRENDAGIEMQFAVNHLGPFILTNLLLDSLRKSPKARIINVSSNAHYRGKLQLDDLNTRKNYRKGITAYGQSKLCNVLFSLELADRLSEEGITVNSLHPGVVNTEIGTKHTTGIAKAIWRFTKNVVAVNAEKGAATSVYLASSPQVEKVTGRYFENCRQRRPSSLAQNVDLAEELWDKSVELTKGVGNW